MIPNERRISRGLFAVLAIVAAMLIAPAVGSDAVPDARADTYSSSCQQWFGNPSVMTPCRGDDQNMDYCTLYSWPSAIGNRFVEAMVNLDTQTVLWDTYENPCNPNTDLGGHISGQSGELVLGNNTLGLYLCTKLLWPAGSRCDQASIIFNSGSTHLNASVQGWNSTQLANARRNVLCHEIGHGVGLYHDTGVGGCMQSGVFTSNLQ